MERGMALFLLFLLFGCNSSASRRDSVFIQPTMEMKKPEESNLHFLSEARPTSPILSNVEDDSTARAPTRKEIFVALNRLSEIINNIDALNLAEEQK